MDHRKVFVVFLVVLVILSLFQIILDFAFDRQYGDERVQGLMIGKGMSETGYCIFIEIEDKTLYLLENGKCVKEYPIASGMSGLPSPLGYWEIMEKGDWGEGFGGRWMGLNVPWGTYGIHGTLLDE